MARKKLWIGLGMLAALAILAWRTMDAGQYRSLTWVILGFVAFRIVLTSVRSRYDGSEKKG